MKLNDELVSTTKAAQMLNLSGARVRLLCGQGRFEGAEKIGRNWIIPQKAVLSYTKLKPGAKSNRETVQKILTQLGTQALENS